jgi:hypothetical protein
MTMRINDVLVEWLESNEWVERPEVNEEEQTSSTEFSHKIGDDFSAKCYFDVNENTCFFKIFMYFLDSKIPEKKLDEVIKYVNLANINTSIGHLTVIPDERVLRYYAAIDVENATIEIQHISNLLVAGLRTLAGRLPQYMAICFGEKTAEEALAIEVT